MGVTNGSTHLENILNDLFEDSVWKDLILSEMGTQEESGHFNMSLEDFKSGNYSHNKDQHVSVFRTFINSLDIYILPLVILVGLLGNILSFMVFICTYMRRNSSSIYLAALAIANLGFLLCILVSWAINTGIDLYTQEGWCQMFIYVTYVSNFLSVWYVVSFTTERYIAVYYPFKRQELCTTRRAKCVVIGLAIGAMTLYSSLVKTTGITVLGHRICGPLPHHTLLYSIINNIDTVITLILPFLAIAFMNIRIAYKVALFYRQQRSVTLNHLANVEAHSRFLQGQVLTKSKTLYTRTQVRVTKMLLIVSTLFLVMNMPRHIVRIYTFIRNNTDEHYLPSYSLIVWQKLFQFLYYLNFSVNIFLYSACGKNFRRAFIWLWKRVVHKFTEYLHKRTYAKAKVNMYQIALQTSATEIMLKELGVESRYL